MRQKLFAEFAGTLLLVMTVIGSGIMAEALAGGNDAVALLGNTIATGAILVVIITIFGPLSGAHFNPAVTLAFVLQKELALPDACFYMFFQVAGGLAGMLLAHGMFDLPLLQLSGNARSGLPVYGAEIIATGGLVLIIMLARAHRPKAIPQLVGLYITAAYWFTSSTSFANPAVTIARTFTDSFSGIAIADTPFFIIAQLVVVWPACILAGWLLGHR